MPDEDAVLISSDEDGNPDNEVTAQDVVNNPSFLSRSDVLAALVQQAKELPACCKKRINALKHLQLKQVEYEKQFFEEVHALEIKYSALYKPIYEKRAKIIVGSYEPTEEESEWKAIEEELCEKMEKNKMESSDEVAKPDSSEESVIVGIPNFWLTALKTGSITCDMIEPHDEPILAHLVDIKVIFTDKPMGFLLEFYFTPNEFFTNSVLTKKYEMKCESDESDALCFEGPEIVKCQGCAIDWKKGKNVTVKTVKKKQKHKKGSAVRTVIKTVQNDSFFNFFNPPDNSDLSPNSDVFDEIQNTLGSDFEIGHFIRERLVPRAVLYFTGEALTDEYDDEEEGEEEEDEDEDDEDDTEASDEEKGDNKKVEHKTKKSAPADIEKPNECKNQ